MHNKRNPEGTRSAQRLIQNHSPFHARKKERAASPSFVTLSKTSTTSVGPMVCHADQQTRADKPKSQQDPENRRPLGIVQGQATDAKES